MIVVGSVNVDLIVQVERRPGGGETVLAGTFEQRAGGKGANQAAAPILRRLRHSAGACIG
ncbi:MAG: PfkB family carbohydrate kinase [Mycetocola sp.]